MQRLILRSAQCPGDVVVMTAAVRELHRQYPNQYQTDVRTCAPALWEHNPHVTPIADDDRTARTIQMHYPLINQSNQRPVHFLEGYCEYLAAQLSLTSLRPQEFRGDIHLTDAERGWLNQAEETTGYRGSFWLVNAGSKNDFTCKQWPLDSFQAVIDHFQGRITFVQIGASEHNHRRLSGVIDLLGKTDHRQLIRLVYHSCGVLTGVSYPMHLAAAVPLKGGRGEGVLPPLPPGEGRGEGDLLPLPPGEGRGEGAPRLNAPRHPRLRPCVVINGGREPAHWEQYPGHQFLHTIGALDCCATGGCWKSRVAPLGDGDPKDRDLCPHPVAGHPRCMRLITPNDVIRAIERYLECGDSSPLSPVAERPSAAITASALARPDSVWNARCNVPLTAQDGSTIEVRPTLTPTLSRREREQCAVAPTQGARLRSRKEREHTVASRQAKAATNRTRSNNERILIEFRHGLGDAVQLTTLLRHLRHYHPDWQIDVAAGVGKHSCYRGLCHDSFPIGTPRPGGNPYRRILRLDWHECPISYGDCPSTKAEYCLRSLFNLTPIADLCGYSIAASPESRRRARSYLEGVCPLGPLPNGRWPAVLVHYQGNTSTEQKNLSHDVARAVCDEARAAGHVPVVLDWDNRSPLIAAGVANPGAGSPLWGGIGTGDAETLAALIDQSCLMIGIDSGPLHVAAATGTPALGVWTRHHPLHYFGHAANLRHLLPANHADFIRGDKQAGLDYFNKNYTHEIYTDQKASLLKCLRQELSPAPRLKFTGDFWIRRENAEQDLVIVEDVAEQDCYRLCEMSVPGPILVDVGAHIGAFSRSFHRRHPSARVVAVECCPENIEALTRNIGGFADVVQAALTYERDVALLNAVYDHCVSTGGSTLISRAELASRCAAAGIAVPAADQGESSARRLGEYWPDLRPLRTLTLEELLTEHRLPRIDVLKLDCEGSEFSILENTRQLDRIGLIAGEYHGRERFSRLVSRRFGAWRLKIIRDADPGTFWLVNPKPPD